MLELNQIIPNFNSGLCGVGFLFGAGTSLKAGYPLSKGLTIKVIEDLNDENKDNLIDILESEQIEYDFSNGIPDIEDITSKVSEYRLKTKEAKYILLESELKGNVIKVFKNNEEPNLKFHIDFLNSLKKLIGYNAQRIFIFTTNYDLSFEMAARFAKIPIYNGFLGTLYRYFDISSFNIRYGNIVNKNRFKELNEPIIILIKLHGSVSWFREGSSIYESNKGLKNDSDNVIILPRNEKIMDTLEYPFDQVFGFSASILGSYECKYLISCGYSFRDVHINDRLIEPNLKGNKMRLISFSENYSEPIKSLTKFPSFSYITQTKSKIEGEKKDEGSILWKFEELTKELKKKAGL